MLESKELSHVNLMSLIFELEMTWMDPIQHPDRLQAGCALAWTLTPSLRQKKCENPLEKQNL
jgi:hypothetical protein